MSKPMSNNVCDVFIAGAGPAGLAAAIALRLRGADVLVADAMRPPIDKPCGEGLMPDARRALARLGVHFEPQHGAEFSGISFISGPHSVSADFPSGPGIGVRRTTLHRLLLDRAVALGVRFAWNTSVVLNPDQPPDLAYEPVSYRWLIGADGASSRVRAWAGLDSEQVRSRRFGFRAHYRIRPGSFESGSDYVEVHWGPIGQVYITPVGRDEICVSAMTRHTGVRLDQILASLPVLRERLASAKTSSTERGCLTVTRRLRRVACDNVALIGDASGSVDAITGEGLALGFREAILLAESLSADSLSLLPSRSRPYPQAPASHGQASAHARPASAATVEYPAALRLAARAFPFAAGLSRWRIGAPGTRGPTASQPSEPPPSPFKPFLG